MSNPNLLSIYPVLGPFVIIDIVPLIAQFHVTFIILSYVALVFMVVSLIAFYCVIMSLTQFFIFPIR